MSGAGLLRDRVTISPAEKAGLVRLSHGLWDLEFPLESKNSAFQAFVDRRSDAIELASTVDGRGIVKLLDATGALTFDLGWLSDARGLLAVYKSLLVEWYSEYYGHPFWERLRNGRAKPKQLQLWALRTYCLSRSVGASASTGALWSTDAEFRQAFHQNALEEYDHCVAFYSLGEADDDRLASNLSQRPASRAIDAHFMAVAECDQWGHALSALYQEQTAMFSTDVLASYREIESAYGLSRRLEGWRDHLTIDLEGDHAGGFARLFESDRSIATFDAVTALTHAWASAVLFRLSVDEIEARQEASAEAERPSSSDYQITRLRFIATKALSSARREEDSVAFGDLLRSTSSRTQVQLETDPFRAQTHSEPEGQGGCESDA